MKISACIIAFNEENKIAEAVESAIWADEILVVDSESADRTRAIAESLGAKVLTKNGQVLPSKNNMPLIAPRTIGFSVSTPTSAFPNN